MKQLSFDEKYTAIVRKDKTFEGLFVTAVKTTGVFCRPVCTARKPKPENVVFYTSAQEAIHHGYRPCRVCKPMELADTTPTQIQVLLQEVTENPQTRLTDADLKKRKIEPSQLRRWFQKNHNMSFHAFQRMIRINMAFTKINTGETITASAFDSGYNSLSGFNERFRSLVGDAPSTARDKTVINITRFSTPLGPMFACATEKGVCLVEFADRKMLEWELNDLKKRLNAVILPGENKHLDQVRREMEEYFTGKLKEFNTLLHPQGSEFQQSVWRALQKVSFGTTCSYSTLAGLLKQPNGVRAVASANGYNKISILIPCHRIIGANGNLTGYGGGLHRKKWLLDFERCNK
jgi:AraC family transcriptional regulator, regulatory protein of adaptative response / methylated-DNA-[protein]-cysteine methyltransferase